MLLMEKRVKNQLRSPDYMVDNKQFIDGII